MEFYLDKKDVAILRVLDGLRRGFEVVFVSKIVEKTPFSYDFVMKRLRKLNKMKLVELRRGEREWGAKILQRGLDELAVWNLVTHGVIKEVCGKIGEGKESVIFSAITPDKEFVVLKFHRYYALEFRKIEKSLAYASVRLRGEELCIEDYEIDVPKAKAQVEYHVLKKISELGLAVPKPIDLDRHVVVMEMIYDTPGMPCPLLKKVKLSNPKEAKEMIKEEYNTIVEKAGIVHGDFSEYNIMVKKDGSFYIIDWPQAVPTSYKLANHIKQRDLENIDRYFKNTYGV